MAAHHIVTSIDIKAPPARVWALLTDFAGMAAWNPFIRSVVGELRPGAQLTVRITPPGKAAMTFRPAVLAVSPERELRWRGRLLFPGLFDGEHYFLIEPLGAQSVRFTHGETFSGLLVGLLRGMLGATEAGFHAMNAALKNRAEAAGT